MTTSWSGSVRKCIKWAEVTTRLSSMPPYLSYIQTRKEPLEETLRRIILEEISPHP
jgi:hypothetical protein